jgi:hypothetical protein
MDNEAHPIQDCPLGKTDQERIQWLEIHLAQLWDQVWWMNLSTEQREKYRAEGFTDPITQFYGRG